MIVRLTHSQFHSIRARLPEQHVATMVEHREPHGRTTHRYTLPAVGWRRALDMLTAVCYGPMGGKLDSVRPSTYRAIRNIAGAVMRVEGHPALKGRSVMATTGEVIPVWLVDTGFDEVATPYPPPECMTARFVLLWPEHGTVLGEQITTWVPMAPPSSGEAEELTYSEDFHLLFGRHRLVDLNR